MSAINDSENDEEKNQPLAEDSLALIQKKTSWKIKCLYVLTIGGVLLIVCFVAFIVIFNGKKDKNKITTKEDKEEPEEDDTETYTYMNLTHYLTAKYQSNQPLNEWKELGDEIVTLFNEKYLDSISSIIVN